MLRPATPLSVLYFLAFAFLLLSTLTSPIIASVPLASFEDFNFGVFGYCDGDDCSSLSVGYDPESPFASDEIDGDFSLPSSTRNSLSAALIVHPVAAFFTLVCFGLAVAAHFHKQAHSTRFHLVLLILSFPTFLICLLAFLIDVLLFLPHVQWGGWIVLASAILSFVSIIMACIMRRTLVSREDRKRRVDENDEMNGQNYYANKAAEMNRADSPPPLSPEPSKGSGFAVFDGSKDKMSEDRMPLNQNISSPGNNGAATPFTDAARSRSRSPGGAQLASNPYGDPMPPLGMASSDMNGPGSAAFGGSNRNHGSPQMGGRGRGGYPPRGGFAPRGGFGPRGGPRGGFGPRGGYGRGGMPPATRRPPPLGINGGGRGMGGGHPGYGMAGAGPMSRGQRGPPPGGPGYAPNGYGPPPQMDAPPPSTMPYNEYGGPDAQIPPAHPHDSIGQALPMDAMHGSPARSPISPPEEAGNAIGMVNLQRHQSRGNGDHLSPTSVYSASEEQFVPARNAWGKPTAQEPVPPIPTQYSNTGGGPPHLQTTPAELDADAPNRIGDGEGYYEDVDPRFVQPPPEVLPANVLPSRQATPNAQGQLLIPGQQPQYLPRDPSYENMAGAGGGGGGYDARSPAASDNSHYTSISQRGVNPYWGGAPGGQNDGYPPPMPPPSQNYAYGGYHQAPPPKAKQQRQQDMLLQDNPMFAVPGAQRGGGGGGGARGRGRGGRTGGPRYAGAF